MKLLHNVHAIRSGVYKDAHGRYDYYSPEDLAAIAEAYNPDLHSAPMRIEKLATAVLGHNDPRTGSAMPAFGWILAARAEGSNLFVDVVIHETLASWIEEGFYQKISMSFYSKDDTRNPTPGVRGIRHIGFLGAEPPVVKGLDALPMPVPFNFDSNTTMTFDKPIEFAEGEETNVAEEMPNWLRYILSTGEKGYKGEITRFDPEPAEDNGFLMNDDQTEFSGRFMDESDEDEPQTYTFRLYQQGDTWNREYAIMSEKEESKAAKAIEEAAANPDQEGAAEEENTAPAEETVAEEEQEPTELGEGCDKDYGEGGMDYEKMYKDVVAERDQLVEAMEAMRKEKRSAEFSEFCEEAGIEADKQPQVIELMHSIDAMQSVEFSEGDKTISPIEFFMSLVSTKPQTATVETGEIEYAETLGADTSVHGKALAHCKANGLNASNNTDYLAAVKAVSV